MSLTPNNNKSLLNLFEQAASTIFQSLNCIKIGVIQSFNPEQQTVSVEIQHKKRDQFIYDEEILTDYPLLIEVPVVILGGGGARITFPIKQGDTCLLLFNDNELDGWWVSGEPLPSEFARRHDLSDAIAIVGLNNLNKLIQGYSQFMQLFYNETSHITIGAETIEVVNPQTNVTGKMNVTEAVTMQQTLDVTGAVTGASTITGEIHSTHGASGSFANAAGNTLTIVDGVITAIS